MLKIDKYNDYYDKEGYQDNKIKEKKQRKDLKQEAFRERRHLHVCDL